MTQTCSAHVVCVHVHVHVHACITNYAGSGMYVHVYLHHKQMPNMEEAKKLLSNMAT